MKKEITADIIMALFVAMLMALSFGIGIAYRTEELANTPIVSLQKHIRVCQIELWHKDVALNSCNLRSAGVAKNISSK